MNKVIEKILSYFIITPLDYLYKEKITIVIVCVCKQEIQWYKTFEALKSLHSEMGISDTCPFNPASSSCGASTLMLLDLQIVKYDREEEFAGLQLS